MPTLFVTTNVPIPGDKKDFVLQFSKFAAETLKKPEKYISVSVTYDEHLTFGGSFDPAFVMAVTSLDNINPTVNEIYSKTFFQYFEEKLKVPGDRAYIVFNDPGRAFIGHQGTTFQTIFG